MQQSRLLFSAVLTHHHAFFPSVSTSNHSRAFTDDRSSAQAIRKLGDTASGTSSFARILALKEEYLPLREKACFHGTENRTKMATLHTKRKRGQSSHFPWHHHTTQTAISATVPSSPIFPISSLSSSSWDPFAIQDVLAVAVIRSATWNEQELRQAYAELESRLQELSEKYEVEVREREALVVRSDAAMVREEALKAEVGALTSDNERKGRSEKEMRIKVDNLSAEVVACQKQQESLERQRADDQSEVKRLKNASAKSQTARLKMVQSIREYRDRDQGTRRRLKEVVGGVTKISDPRDLVDIVVKRLRTMDDRLDIEKNARRKAEAQAEETRLMLDKVKQECREPFVVPALLEAMALLENMTSQIVS